MILAVDPSITNCGYAVLEDKPLRRVESGTWRPSQAKGSADRFDQLAWFIDTLIGEHGVTEVVVETPSGGQRHSATQLMTYARAIGVVEAAAFLAGRPARRVPVLTWKGNTGKGLTALRVKAALGYEAGDDNESDAIGLGIYWINHGKRA